MYLLHLSVEGAGVEDLVAELAKDYSHYTLPPEPGGDPIAKRHLLTREKRSSWWGASFLVSVLIVTIHGSRRCSIDIVTGGDTGMLLILPASADERRNREIADHIQRICDERSWNLAIGEPVDLSKPKAGA